MSKWFVELFVPEEPQSKQRAVIGKGGARTPQKTKDYEAEIALAYVQKYTEDCRLEGVAMEAEVYLGFSAPKEKKVYISSKDNDNLYKAPTDALNNLTYGDDKYIVISKIVKFYANNPGVFIRIRPTKNPRCPKELDKYFFK